VRQKKIPPDGGYGWVIMGAYGMSNVSSQQNRSTFTLITTFSTFTAASHTHPTNVRPYLQPEVQRYPTDRHRNIVDYQFEFGDWNDFWAVCGATAETFWVPQDGRGGRCAVQRWLHSDVVWEQLYALCRVLQCGYM
jgi:hypothetical protein